jgi:hypothetical protein
MSYDLLQDKESNGPIRWIALVLSFVAGPYLILVPLAQLTQLRDLTAYAALGLAFVPVIVATLMMNWGVHKKFFVCTILVIVSVPHIALAGLLAACSIGDCI